MVKSSPVDNKKANIMILRNVWVPCPIDSEGAVSKIIMFAFITLKFQQTVSDLKSFSRSHGYNYIFIS
jgi:hypothetical protein